MNRSYTKSNEPTNQASHQPIAYHFYEDTLSSFPESVLKEWSLTNGIGGYGGGSINGALGRTHHGYLIASLHPPVERYLALAKTKEALQVGSRTFDLDCNLFQDDSLNDGNRYLKHFCYDGTVSFTYEIPTAENDTAVSLTKNIALIRGENTCVISYEIHSYIREEIQFHITPILNFKEHSTSTASKDLRFLEMPLEKACGFTLIPEDQTNVTITSVCSQGQLQKRDSRFYDQVKLPVEVALETEGFDCHYMPYDFVISVPGNTDTMISFLCTLEDFGKMEKTFDNSYCSAKIEMERERKRRLVNVANYTDTFANQLVLASDSFLSYRQSTGLTTILAGLPWFTDWGRDTMIAFTGLTLCTNRFQEAREILMTFARYVHHGMIPNMFPDNGAEPLYNTADASLWYFYGVQKYLEYDSSPEGLSFIQKEIYPALLAILQGYEHGTDFSIYMDQDGLIHAGGNLDQVTWMDVRVGEWVPTPRHGKPVEINALWYNALCFMNTLIPKLDDSINGKELACHYGKLSEKVKASFCEKFWNPDMGCLYDVLPDDVNDVRGEKLCIRPNQIYAVSLPYTMLSKEQEASILEVVRKELFVGVGLRSLSRQNKEYHPIYCGSLDKRDAAYHQGTAWGFLLGAFYTAFMKVHGHTAKAAFEAVEMLAPVRSHLLENGIGTICEIFDGDAPHYGRGCYGQAWSVAEILRAYAEDILPYLSEV